MGESYGHYHVFDDIVLMPFINSCNVACGFHAGDPLVIKRCISDAIKYNLEIGAHPSFPDRQGFGRRKMDMDPYELEALVGYQVAAIKGVTESLGGQLNHVKTHGALYNEAAQNQAYAEAIVEAVFAISPSLYLYAPPNSIQAEIARAKGLKVQLEGFLDRRYTDDLQLVSRKLEHASIHEPADALEQLSSILNLNVIKTFNGKILPFHADTFCIHGDNPKALEIIKLLRMYFPMKA